MPRNARCLSLAAALLILSGCTPLISRQVQLQTGGNAALFNQFKAYDARTGRLLNFPQLVRMCDDADVIFFGEAHGDTVCNQIQAQLFAALHQARRPLALAMEFFEADTQAALNAYLRERLPELDFREQARQSDAYVLSHRPLIEYCAHANIPVIAANAPRSLVRAYRISETDFDAFCQALPPDDLRWLPTHFEPVAGQYYLRFLDIMGGHSMPNDDDHEDGQPDPQPADDAATPAMPPKHPEHPPVGETTEPGDHPSPQSQPADHPEPPNDHPAPHPHPKHPPSAQTLPESQEQTDEHPTQPQPPADPATQPPDAPPEHQDHTGTSADQYQPADSAKPPHHAETPQDDKVTQDTDEAPELPENGEDPVESEDKYEPGTSVERFYQAMLLWDNAMAESIARYRDQYPRRRVMLIVGMFHVESDGGTAQAYDARRPDDRTLTIVYRPQSDPDLPFDPEDRHAGNIIIYGLQKPSTPPAMD